MSFEVASGESVQALYDNIHDKSRRGYSVISGGEVTLDSGVLGAGDTLSVSACDYLWNGEQQSASAQTVSIGDSETEPRKDVVYLDGTGTVQVATGTSQAKLDSQTTDTRFNLIKPAPDDLDGTDAVVLAEVFVDAGASSLDSGDIGDRRAFVSDTVSVLSDGVLEDASPLTLDFQGGVSASATDGTVAVTSSGGYDSVASVSTTHVASDQEIVLADASAGAFNVELPSPSEAITTTVKKIDNTSNAVTVVTPGSETIDGMADYPITGENVAYEFTSDGSNYYRI